MNRIHSRTLVASIALTFSLAAGVAVYAQGPGVAARVGDALDNTGRAIKGSVQNAFSKSRTQVHTMEVLDRVYSRLHWDKALTLSTIEIDVRAGGVTVLRGVVVNDKAKKLAVDLAKTTVGVTQVVDELSVSKSVDATDPAPVVVSPEK